METNTMTNALSSAMEGGPAVLETVEELGEIDDADRGWRRWQHDRARRARATDEESKGGDCNARGECGDGRASVERKCERWHR